MKKLLKILRFFHKKRFYRNVTIILSVCVLIAVICNSIIEKNTKSLNFSSLEAIPANKVGLVLGTNPLLKNGNVNRYFLYRVDAVEALFKAEKIEFILISGDNGRQGYNEPEAFKKALLERGIPAERIFLDYAGFRTLDSVIRAREIFGLEEFTIISQQFHNERAIYIAQQNGINAIGFNAQDVTDYNGFKTKIREYLARTKLFIDILLGTKPKFLGEKIEIK